jgi:PAS domain S-box-containing protein
MNVDHTAPPPAFAWGRKHDFSLRVMQVEELYDFAPVATSFSYFGAFLTFGVLMDTGDTRAGLFWFCLATATTLYRFVVIWGYENRRGSAADPELWANLVIAGNFFAGIQWGILGTFLFPAEHGYREIFTMMVITCFVGGSVTSYASVKWAHPALALPAAVPPAIYMFFVQDGVHAYAGAAALFFTFAIVYYALKLNRHIGDRLRLIIENRDLLAQVRIANDSLTRENQQLAHRAEVRRRSMQVARNEVHLMAEHFQRTPLPMLECDAGYRLLSWNEAAEKLFGYTLDEAYGQNLAALLLLLPAEKHAKAMSVMRHLVSGGRPRSLKCRAITKSGRLLHCTFHVTPVIPADGSPVRVDVIVSDVKDLGHFKQVA